MTPDIDVLAALAADIMARVPADVLTGKTPTALYGMGFVGRWVLNDLARQGIRFNACFDGNQAFTGQSVDGVVIHAVDELASMRPDFVFVAARHAVPQISARLTSLGIAHVSSDAFYVARDFAAFMAIHDGLLDADRSRAVLRSVMMAMLTGDKAHLAPVYEKDQYFCLPRFSGIEKETYVDAGAYVGDSLERFIWTVGGIFKRAIVFEPGPRQFDALKRRTDRLIAEWALDAGQIALVPAALGEISGMAFAESQNGQMTSLAIGSSGDQLRVERLDDYLKGERITFLKADVEGMEVALLAGAADTIRAHRPKLAICVYHYPSDIPTITQYLKSLVPEYRFALRHHSPQLLETVLYAWAE